MTRASTAFLLCVFGLVAPVSFAQNSNGGAPGDMSKLLLRPGGWVIEWKQVGSGPDDYGNPQMDTGAADLIFQAQGGNVYVKVQNITDAVACDGRATLSGETVTIMMCLGDSFVMHFDDADRKYPFKGGTYVYDARMSAK
jgi:hypothetical protein